MLKSSLSMCFESLINKHITCGNKQVKVMYIHFGIEDVDPNGYSQIPLRLASRMWWLKNAVRINNDAL